MHKYVPCDPAFDDFFEVAEERNEFGTGNSKKQDEALNEEDEFKTPIDADYMLKVFRLCMHELGHYVVARSVGAEPHNISINFSSPNKYRGHCDMSVARPLDNIDAVQKYLEDRVAILMAGTLGEHLSLDNSLKGIHDEKQWLAIAKSCYEQETSSSSDKDKADELLRMLAFMGGFDSSTSPLVLGERAQAICVRIWLNTANILKAIARDFYIVSQELAARITHSGKKIVIPSAEIESYFVAARAEGDPETQE